MYWASELDLAGFGNYVWKRLRIIASEDVGLVDPSVAVLVRTLYENWLEQRKARGCAVAMNCWTWSLEPLRRTETHATFRSYGDV